MKMPVKCVFTMFPLIPLLIKEAIQAQIQATLEAKIEASFH